MNKTIYLLILILYGVTNSGNAQTVTIDHKTKRFIGNTSQLDRQKYFTLHSGSDDTEHKNFFNAYNASQGRGFWGPFSSAKNETGNVGSYPVLKGGDGQVKSVTRTIQTEHPSSVFKDGMDKYSAAAWAADYYVNANSRPEFFEAMNEPFVHTKDFYSGPWNKSEELRIMGQMAQVYNEIGYKIHQAPELANMKVLGYSSAWPSFELWNFGHWNERMKMFMDVAGKNMDGFSTHFYDGLNVTGQDNKRSGSNVEAILDLIETYSFNKWGTIKPHAITEYGAIEEGYGDNYSDIASAQSVRSQNHLIFSLLEREDRMLISIPFNTGKAEWHISAANNYQPYGAALFKPSNIGEPNPTGWVYTPRITFYEIWKNVKGNRVDIKSDNPDIQAQAFAEGKKLYLALNNLDDSSSTVNLNMIAGLEGLQNVRIKTLKIHKNSAYQLDDSTQNDAPSNISLIPGETAVLEYTFSSDIAFSNTVNSKNYYTGKHLQPINANSTMSFTFNGVQTGTGQAKIKMAIGRKHDVSKIPQVKVNGTIVSVPTNIKGYDQANRDDFFGTIEIPVSMALLQTNNTITFNFPDSGGHLASVILNVEKYDSDTGNSSQSPYSGSAISIPGTLEMENYDLGGEGVAYHDKSNGNAGGKYRSDDVDVSASSEGGHMVGWTAVGEWLEYTVDVQSAGDYDLDIRYASFNNAGSIYVAFDGVNKTGSTALPVTGGWQTYNTVSKTVNLQTGTQVIRVYVETAGINLDYLKFEKHDTPSNSNTVHIKKRNSTDFAIDGNNGGADNQNVYLYEQSVGNANQQWVEIDQGEGYYSYQKNNTNYCLDGGNGGENGQNVYLWTCSDINQNQHWKKIEAGGDHYRLEKRNASNFSLDGGNGGSNLQNLYLWTTDHSNQNQHWKLSQ